MVSLICKPPPEQGWFKTIFIVLLFLWVALAPEAAPAQGYSPGDTLYGRNRYIEYLPGDLPLVFAAPHGGDLQPPEIPDRSHGTTVTDSHTRETVLAIRDAFYEKTGHLPHIVISHLRRTKLDPNREIEEAAQGNPHAEQAWREYHGFIETARDSIGKHAGAGFFIDIHGHGHPNKRLELGYLISGTSLRQSDSELNKAVHARNSSLRHLAQYTPDTFAGLLRGRHSLGTLFEQRGIPAVPSGNQPYPAPGERFFSGGYSTQRHGSLNGGVIDGIQIEAWYTGLRDSAANRRFYAETMVEVLNDFVRYHYGWPDLSQPSAPVRPSPAAISTMRVVPNPADASTQIRYIVSSRSVTLSARLYNSNGRLVAVFPSLPGTVGEQHFRLNTSTLSSGLYFLMMKQTGGQDITLKMLVLH